MHQDPKSVASFFNEQLVRITTVFSILGSLYFVENITLQAGHWLPTVGQSMPLMAPCLLILFWINQYDGLKNQIQFQISWRGTLSFLMILSWLTSEFFASLRDNNVSFTSYILPFIWTALFLYVLSPEVKSLRHLRILRHSLTWCFIIHLLFYPAINLDWKIFLDYYLTPYELREVYSFPSDFSENTYAHQTVTLFWLFSFFRSQLQEENGDENHWNAFLFMISGLLCFSVILVCASRGAQLLFFSLIAIKIWSHLPKQHQAEVLRTFVLITITATLFSSAMLLEFIAKDNSASTRLNTILNAIELLQSYPIFGVGSSQIFLVQHEGFSPHSFLAEVLACFGLLGFLLFVCATLSWFIFRGLGLDVLVSGIVIFYGNMVFMEGVYWWYALIPLAYFWHSNKFKAYSL